MRVVFAGTPEFAAVALAALHDAGFTIPLVLTQPDRPAGRGMQLQPSPVKQYALAHGMPVAQPVSLRLDGKFPDDAAAAHELLRSTPHDVMVVAAYVPGNSIKARLKHPMLLGTKLWAFAHLLVNWDVGSLILFGAMATLHPEMIGVQLLPVLAALGQLCRAPGHERFRALLEQQAPTWLAQMGHDPIGLDALQQR